MFYLILILLFMNGFSTSEASQRPTTPRKKSFAALLLTSTNNLTPSDKNSCQWLRRLKNQRKICLQQRGLGEVLLSAKNISINQCQTQFEFEQWNCSRRDFFFQKIYRETAFMYSLASSAVMYSIARACSDGTLSTCACGKPGKPSNSPKWQWGGCSDNTRYAARRTKKLMQMRKKGDGLQIIAKHNMAVGIKIVMENEERVCRCHGVSGSCTVETCYKRIRDFEKIAKQLQSMYHSAIFVQPQNNVQAFKTKKYARKLLYLDASPNFCASVAGRHCNSRENCATVCCGGDPVSKQVSVLNNTCICRWRKERFDVDCQSCQQTKTIFLCK